jgi:hypothetical protein
VLPGAITGAMLLQAVNDLNESRGGFATSTRDALIQGALIGAAEGAVYGALFPAERWKRVRLDGVKAAVRPPAELPGRVASVGHGALSTHSVVGSGPSVSASVPLVRLGRFSQLRGELLYQEASLHGSPLSCEQVDEFYCLGRSDEQRLLGADVALLMANAPRAALVRPFYVPLSVGLYHRRTASEEHQGPTATCFSDSGFVPCANNPPFATLRSRGQRTFPTLGTGFGLALGRGRFAPLLDFRMRFAPVSRENQWLSMMASAGVGW